MQLELLALVQDALASLEPLDREILALRHFEHLNSAEAAEVLGIAPAAAAKRYFRSLKRLKETLAQIPGGPEELLR
jgi:RNA polymerase sigma-70 factor (ECF subfamily)